MNARPDNNFRQALALHELLEKAGGLYSVADILHRIKEGKMQSFAEGDTWVVTEVHTYPRRKVLDILFVVGDLSAALAVGYRIEAFAKDHGCTLIRAWGRDGWLPHAKVRGWNETGRAYEKVI